MTLNNRLGNSNRGLWNGGIGPMRADVTTPCRPSCCKTPFGHSTAATNCTCHSTSAVTGGRPAGSVGEVREKTKGGGRRGVETVAGLPNPAHTDSRLADTKRSTTREPQGGTE